MTACGLRLRVGRRAALVLALPAMTIGLASVLLAASGPLVFTGLPIVTAAVFYGAPLSVLFALGALPRDPERRPDHG